MSKPWFVVANSMSAKIYSSPQDKQSLVLIKEWTQNPTQSQTSDMHQPTARLDYSHEQSTLAKQKEHKRFAQELAQFIEGARIANRFADLIIIALPDFQGLLWKQLSDETKKHRIRKILKDFTPPSLTPAEIEEELLHLARDPFRHANTRHAERTHAMLHSLD